MHKNFEQKQNIKKYFITKNRLKYSITKTDIISSSRVVKKKKKTFNAPLELSSRSYSLDDSAFDKKHTEI